MRRRGGKVLYLAASVAAAIGLFPLIVGLFLFASVFVPVALVLAVFAGLMIGLPEKRLRGLMLKVFIGVGVLILVLASARRLRV